MQHPPPNNTGNARCDSMPWSAPFGPNYTVPSSSTGSNSSLQLTLCNWYLPQGPGVTAVHRCGRGLRDVFCKGPTIYTKSIYIIYSVQGLHCRNNAPAAHSSSAHTKSTRHLIAELLIKPRVAICVLCQSFLTGGAGSCGRCSTRWPRA
jgi:hypothetical protein